MLSGGAGYTEGVFGYVARTEEARAVEMFVVGQLIGTAVGLFLVWVIVRAQFGGRS